ncbi:MAG: serine/threonine-protein phosphatase, partial [Oscillospiraceae bacterium]
GDSRAYIVGRKIKQVTHDHSVVQELLDSKKITSEQARNHPNKNIITSALGVEDSIRVDYNEQHISKGDSLLICTDGLSNMITDEDIMQVVQECDFYKTADILVKMAREAGGYDNITAVLLSM